MSRESVLQALQAGGLKRPAAGEPLARHTSWRIGGPADYLCVAEDQQQLLAAVQVARDHAIPWLVLGGGNNVLVSDAGVKGLVILNRLKGIGIEELSGDAALVCGAGVFFARAAQFSAKRGYTGMEWGIAVPGTVGGGVVNNAGAHWSDVARTLESATAIDADGRARTFSRDDLAYRYRQSALKLQHLTQSRLVVTACRFRLEPDDPVQAMGRLEELRRHRLRTQPVKEASAGSTFKNPPSDAAGALIDRAGLKGRRMGGAQISPLHANFILNAANATADDVLGLIRLAQVTVRERFGIELEPEVQFVGRWDTAALESVLAVPA